MILFVTVIADVSWWTQFTEVLPLLVSLVIIEGLLSVDNALAIAALAAHLPAADRTRAMRLGIIGAYPLRVLALFAASLIIQNAWLKILGAAYLLHLMAEHFSEDAEDDAHGAGSSHGRHVRSFWSSVMAIQFLNLSLSVDNVVAAVAMSPRFWVVCTGVLIGILALMFLAGWCLRLIERFPILEDAAFLLIGYVGVLLLYELGTHRDIGATGKFIGIIAILALSLAYARYAGLRAVLGPILRALRWPLRAYAALISVLFVPFRWLRRKPAAKPLS